MGVLSWRLRTGGNITSYAESAKGAASRASVPLLSYIGDDCSMNNANETRAEFNHLIAVAKDTGCAIVIIAHMNKAKGTSPPLPYQRFYRHCGRCEKYSRHHTNRKQRKSSRTLFGASKIQSCSNGFGYSF